MKIVIRKNLSICIISVQRDKFIPHEHINSVKTVQNRDFIKLFDND